MSSALQIYEQETIIPMHVNIRFHPGLTYGEKIFFAEIQAMSKKNKKENLPFSSRKLSEYFNVSHQTILTWVKKLQELDLIEIGLDYTNHGCKQFLKIKDKK